MNRQTATFTDRQNFTRVTYHIPPAFSDAPLELEVRFARCKEAPLPFRAECVRQAERLFEAAAGVPIVVHLSGGIDSEVVARSFMEAGLPFRAVTFAYAQGNGHDLKWAREFCRQHGVTHQIIPLDERAFLAHEAGRLMRTLSVNEPFPAFEIQRQVLSEGFVVMGNGDPHLVCEDGGDVELVDYYGDLAIQRWQAEGQHAGCPKFFRASPEIFLSFLKDPGVRLWVENCAELRLEQLGWWKYYAFRRHWPDLLPRPKATGYEMFARDYLRLDHELETEFCYSGFASRVPYAELIQALEPSP